MADVKSQCVTKFYKVDEVTGEQVEETDLEKVPQRIRKIAAAKIMISAIEAVQMLLFDTELAKEEPEFLKGLREEAGDDSLVH